MENQTQISRKISLGLLTGYRAAGVLGLTTVREVLRSRLLWVSVFFSAIMVAASVAGASVALYEQARLIVDVGLAATSLVGTVVAVAATLIFYGGEFTHHTAYVTLARPVPRWSLVLGKFVGLWAVLWLMVGIMGLTTAIVLACFGSPLPQAFMPGIFLTGMEMGLVIGLAQLMVSLASPSLAAAYTAALLLAANMSGDIMALASRLPDSLGRSVVMGLFYALPDLDQLSLRGCAANNLPVPPGFVLDASVYALCSMAIVVCLSAARLSHRRAL